MSSIAERSRVIVDGKALNKHWKDELESESMTVVKIPIEDLVDETVLDINVVYVDGSDEYYIARTKFASDLVKKVGDKRCLIIYK